MERWIVLLNCQTQGVADCLSLLNPGIEITACDIARFRAESGAWLDRLPGFDRVLLNDEVINLGLIDIAALPGLIRVPPLLFRGYHPDLCYAAVDGRLIRTPLDDYHSIIALAACKKGLNERDTVALYGSRLFERGGYFGLWAASEAALSRDLDAYGYALPGAIRRWSMRGAFMYSINHPRIDCLYDLAVAVSIKAGRTPVVSGLRPPDLLARGPVFPVYPDIAERVGAEGSYHFKRADRFQLIGLEEFVAASFAEYHRHGPDRVATGPRFITQFQAVFDAI